MNAHPANQDLITARPEQRDNALGGDPALRVDCPRCAARPSERCLWSGPHGLTTHIAHDMAAMQAGQMTRCGALTWDGRHSRHLILSCVAPPLTSAPVGQLALL